MLDRKEVADIIWVGQISKRKGVDKLAGLVALLADVHFTVVGALTDPELAGPLRELQNRPNVRWLSGLSHERTLDEMSRSRILINTSISEGFAHTIIEAWSLGKPVITYNVNPNGLLSGDSGLGECANGNLGLMATAIRAHLDDPVRRMLIGKRARKYVESIHSPDRVCDSFEALASP